MKFKDLVREYLDINEAKDINNSSDGFKGKKLKPAGAPHLQGNPKKKDINNNTDAFAGKGKGTSGPNYNVNNSTLGNPSKHKNIENSSNGFGKATNESVELTEAKKDKAKKHEKKETKKEEKKEHKHSGEQSYKGQYPEGVNYNKDFTGKPKSGKNGKLIADKALQSINTEVKAIKEGREILDDWKKKVYRAQKESPYTKVEKKIDPKTGKPYHTFQRDPNRYLNATKEGKEVLGKKLPASVEKESTPPNEKQMGEKDLMVKERRKKLVK